MKISLIKNDRCSHTCNTFIEFRRRGILFHRWLIIVPKKKGTYQSYNLNANFNKYIPTTINSWLHFLPTHYGYDD